MSDLADKHKTKKKYWIFFMVENRIGDTFDWKQQKLIEIVITLITRS